LDGIESILRVLEDGNWHPISDLAARVGRSSTVTEQIVEFLSDHGLLNYRSREKMVRLDPEFLTLMKLT
jgi:DNA-binding IclR family transcriptional regulator